MTTARLEVRNVTKRYPSVVANSGVSLTVAPGEIHAVLGENGAGKSTLMNVISGAVQPDSGSLKIAGKPVEHLTPAAAKRLGVAAIRQQPALFPTLTVAENIGLALEPFSAPCN